MTFLQMSAKSSTNVLVTRRVKPLMSRTSGLYSHGRTFGLHPRSPHHATLPRAAPVGFMVLESFLFLVSTTALTQASASDLISFEHWHVTILRIHAIPYLWYPVHKL